MNLDLKMAVLIYAIYFSIVSVSFMGYIIVLFFKEIILDNKKFKLFKSSRKKIENKKLIMTRGI